MSVEETLNCFAYIVSSFICCMHIVKFKLSLISACKLKSGSGAAGKSKELLIDVLLQENERMATIITAEKSTAADLENVRATLHITELHCAGQ